MEVTEAMFQLHDLQTPYAICQRFPMSFEWKAWFESSGSLTALFEDHARNKGLTAQLHDIHHFDDYREHGWWSMQVQQAEK